MRDLLTRRRLLATAGGLAVALSFIPGNGGAVATLPPIKHVWVVVLENKGFADSYVNNPNPYLPSLPRKGTFIPNYFGTAHQSLPNYIALIGGQGPVPQTHLDCQYYADLVPGSPAQGNGHQAQGDGCVYPAAYPTIADQLSGAGLTWKGYMEDLGLTPSRDDPMTCKDPVVPPTQDTTQKASILDQYATRHDPFMYYHSVIDSPSCSTNVVQLQSAQHGLLHDLASAATTPNFSFISPNLCNDGHDAPCTGRDVVGDQAGGLRAVDHWLQKYVPAITGSPAYRQDGMLVITFDETDTTGDDPSTSAASCCNENLAADGELAGGYGFGGGQVGAIVLSPFAKPGTTTQSSYNHYSLLRSVEDVFHLSGGDGTGGGHLGWAADYGAAGTSPGSFGPDVFTNPGYRPPGGPSQGNGGSGTTGGGGRASNVDVPAPVGGDSGLPQTDAAPDVPPATTGAASPAAAPARAWAPRFVAASGPGSGLGLYALVLLPLLAVGVAASMLARRRRAASP